MSDASYKGQSSDWVVLWSAKLNKTSHTISQLKFDPTEETHTYKLVINEDTSMFDEVSIEINYTNCSITIVFTSLFLICATSSIVDVSANAALICLSLGKDFPQK